MVGISRRDFLITAAGAMVCGSSAARAALAKDVPWAGEKVVDCHFHGRATDEALIAHLDGAGISNTMILSQEDFANRMPALRASYPGRVLGWSRGSLLASSTTSTDTGPAPETPPELRRLMKFLPTPEAVEILIREVKAGAKGLGETAGLVQADGPELQRLYALAAELDVPILMHFQQNVIPGLPRYGISGFSRIEAMLKQFPKTRFICHASDFWGHIDSEYQDGGVFPTANKVNRGGLSDRLLADYPNMYGDLSAPSGYMQLSRDLDFTADFLQRHQHKLIFGSDCGCADGRGGSSAAVTSAGTGSTGVAAATRGLFSAAVAGGSLAGKCVARELLGVVWKTTPRNVFRRLAWNNGIRTYKLPA
jgi:hypothetical protein